MLLWVLGTPWVGGALLRTRQTAEPLPASGALPAAGAIVVLSAGYDREARELGGPTVGRLTLQRLRYAAELRRRTGLPLLCSGGTPASDLPALADMMAESLRRDFGIEGAWRETDSGTTWENAVHSARILEEQGITSVLLVTSAWHMPRAVFAFERQGLAVVPAPTGFRGPTGLSFEALLPDWKGLRDSSWAVHEWLGLVFYRLAHG